MSHTLRFTSLVALAMASCSPSVPPPAGPRPPPASSTPPATSPPRAVEATPTLRLPADTRPTGEKIELTIDPKSDRFSGVVDIAIKLDRARDTVWLHGLGFHVTRATVTAAGGAAAEATWEERGAGGIASLTLAQTIPAGAATLHVEFDAPFGTKLEGLYKVSQSGVPYAFTQFESIAARRAFPCFDEPGFKVPFDVTLIVPSDAQAIANTHEIDRKASGATTRVQFAPTLPLPSYLVAFAVGPLDIVTMPDVPANSVRKRTLPLRGVTAKGRGREIAYAMAHTGEILTKLEQYFGLEYPYDKLDILAVPDKGGAMENPGAVTYSEYLVLFDEKTAPLQQKRSYAGVMAHELAHQWVGDLVTAAWWDDIWLNEAFATWMGSKAADAWDPKSHGAMHLLEGIQYAIGSDSLVSARSIRQPIASTNDIENAFDGITYQKGGGVLTMFERWLGPDAFQRGVHEYLASHAHGSATADDFLAAVSKSTGKDVSAAFHTFLDQPGVPFVEAEVRCDGKPRLHLKQSRYLPMGSTGDADKTWQLPVCARFHAGKETKEACLLLTEKEGDLALGDVCPDWVFPNADAAGYLRFALAPPDLAKLRKSGFAALSTRERVAYGNSLRAALNRGAVSMKDTLEAAAPLASDRHREVASEPMGFVGLAREWLYDDKLRASVESYGRQLFEASYKSLGWDAAKGDDEERAALRASVIGFMVATGRDPAARTEAKKRGLALIGFQKDGAIHREAVDKDLAGTALHVVGEDADRAVWDAIRAQLGKTEDAELRSTLLRALSAAQSPELIALVRELALDPALHVTEVTTPIWSQLGSPKTRDDTWEWVKKHFDELSSRVAEHHGKTQLISMGSVFCDEAHRADVESFLTTRAAAIDGGPRVLAATLEDIRLCAAKRKAAEPSAREFFGKRR